MVTSDAEMLVRCLDTVLFCCPFVCLSWTIINTVEIALNKHKPIGEFNFTLSFFVDTAHVINRKLQLQLNAANCSL